MAYNRKVAYQTSYNNVYFDGFEICDNNYEDRYIEIFDSFPPLLQDGIIKIMNYNSDISYPDYLNQHDVDVFVQNNQMMYVIGWESFDDIKHNQQLYIHWFGKNELWKSGYYKVTKI